MIKNQDQTNINYSQDHDNEQPYPGSVLSLIKWDDDNVINNFLLHALGWRFFGCTW